VNQRQRSRRGKAATEAEREHSCQTFLSAAGNGNSRAIKTFTATDTEGIAADGNVRAPAQETSAPANNFDYCSAEAAACTFVTPSTTS
jgi:hypothetical protein